MEQFSYGKFGEYVFVIYRPQDERSMFVRNIDIDVETTRC